MGDDLISVLPDELLCHILYFVPTNVALATRVLSKRWRRLSYHRLYFDFDVDDYDDDSKRIQAYIKFVIMVYQSLYHSHIPKTIRIRCNYFRHTLDSFLAQWLKAAKDRGVEDLTLSLPRRKPFIFFPPYMLTSPALVVLDLTQLSLCNMQQDDCPSLSVDLPSLKTLRLTSVCFKARDDFLKLLLGCPVLEDLVTAHLSFKDISDFTSLECDNTPFAKLTRADTYSVHHLPVPMSAFYNVEFLNMTLLAHDNSLYNAFPVFNNLIHFDIFVRAYRGWDLALQLLQHCPKLQTLIMKMERRMPLSKEEWTYPASVPECLSSHLRTISLRDYGGFKKHIQFAKYILQNARVLRAMTIRCSSKMDKRRAVEKLSSFPKISPECKLSVGAKGKLFHIM